ncbi:MAG: photosystem II complex extrinsic protein PsbU [Leptolyngbya sp. SIOISBB]|nr:photosystem II complex extrinsic protein PsbU [Leptolyngbya sp. SIOISBB]
MKTRLSLLTKFVIGLVLGVLVWLGLGFNQPAIAQRLWPNQPELTNIAAQIWRNPVDERLGKVSTKLDLNNANVLAFRRYPGLYPTLARKIIRNAPFDTVEDVLNIPGLSDREIDLLKANLDNFVVMPSEPALTEGGDRINPGIYK